ncbi:oligosaccharide repeat unit polymerase [Photobacterium carnosum]|uniref:O-antigen polymerase n=1 Tax=Photobacterium carnosum TaxID=2023717 RepID=UPI001E607794|nr:O-antigen polymerase [Photobacterium carnosum]MCD9544490.1 oligosaccharide repeat unit polymerase [Photobacterium carnosum]
MNYSAYALFIIVFFCVIASYRKMSLFSPLVINCFAWSVSFVPGIFFYEDYYPITNSVFTAWVVWFFVTNILFIKFDPQNPNRFKESCTSSLEIKFNYQYIIYILALVLAYRIWVVGSSGPSQFFLNLRLGTMHEIGYQTLGLIERFYPLILALFVFENIYESKNNLNKRIALWLWMALFALAVMGKFAILTPILIWIGIKILKKEITVKTVFFITIFTVLVMVFMQLIRSDSKTSTDYFKLLSIYTYSPIVGLGYVNFNLSPLFGANSLRFFYAISYALGFNNTPVNLIFSYVEIPVLTNVYTVLYPFYMDFKIGGVFVFSVIYGCVFGLLYKGVNFKNTFFMALYFIFLPALFTQFFVESLFSLLSLNIQVTFCLLIIFIISRKSDANC